jgi:hypothetical protein
MTYSVLTKVTNDHYGEQTALSEREANKLKSILDEYPEVFSETKIVPRENEEIKLLDPSKITNEPQLDFDFEYVSDDCDGILNKLENSFDSTICGIDRDETVRQTFENK